MSVDMGQYDAMKSQPRSKEEVERIFAEYKARVNQFRDVANKLPTYEEVKEHLNPALKARTLEWVKEWEERKAK